MIIPALLTTNPRIASERITLAQQMSGWLHIDVLDNTLYPFESLSAPELAELDWDELLLEFHCMTNAPDQVINSDVSVERLIMHYEMPQWKEAYDHFVHHGIDTWLAVDPTTRVESLELPDDLGGIVVMGVVPGQMGQSFLEQTYERLHHFKDRYPDIPITVDGGVREDTIRNLMACGVDNLVMGSAIFNDRDPIAAYHRYASLSDPIHGMHNWYDEEKRDDDDQTA